MSSMNAPNPRSKVQEQNINVVTSIFLEHAYLSSMEPFFIGVVTPASQSLRLTCIAQLCYPEIEFRLENPHVCHLGQYSYDWRMICILVCRNRVIGTCSRWFGPHNWYFNECLLFGEARRIHLNRYRKSPRRWRVGGGWRVMLCLLGRHLTAECKTM